MVHLIEVIGFSSPKSDHTDGVQWILFQGKIGLMGCNGYCFRVRLV